MTGFVNRCMGRLRGAFASRRQVAGASHAGTLLDLCSRRGLDVDARLKLFESVCMLVQAAHAAGYVHEMLTVDSTSVADVSGELVVDVSGFGLFSFRGLESSRADLASARDDRGWLLVSEGPLAERARQQNIRQLGTILAKLIHGVLVGSELLAIVRRCGPCTEDAEPISFRSVKELGEAVTKWLASRKNPGLFLGLDEDALRSR